MSIQRMTRPLVMFMGVVLFSCGGDGGNEADLSADIPDLLPTDEREMESDSAPAEVVPSDSTETDGVDLDTIVAPAPKAFVIQDSADLLPGRAAVGRIGDFRIGNDHITAVIGAANHSIWGPFGGGVLDFTVAGGEDYFEEQFPIAGFLRGVRVETMEVVSDGSDGEAVIRIQGKDGPIPIVASVIPLPPAGVDVTVEYALGSESKCLEIRTSITNGTEGSLEVPIGDGITFSESGRTFGSGAGFDTGALVAQGAVDFLGSDLPTVSYVMAPSQGGHMTIALIQEELNAVLYGTLNIAPGQTRMVKRCLYATSGRSIHALENYWAERGVELVEMAGKVEVSTAGFDFSAVALDMSKEGSFVGVAGPDSTGAFGFRVPVGSYAAVLTGPGIAPFDVAWESGSGEATAPLAIDPPDPGRIDVAVVDQEGGPVPARIMAQQGLDAAFGAFRVALVPSIQGAVSLFLEAGDYTVQGSHGPEWSYCRKSLSLAAGEVEAVTCPIEQELSVTGWVQGDMHTHSEYSIDSQLPREQRVSIDLAEGLAFWVSTDHDVFTDFTDVVKELGVEGQIMCSLGNEVSPVGRHFNGLGCTPPLSAMYRYFAVPWVGFDAAGEVTGSLPAPEVWRTMHEDFGCRVVQINHPRDTQGYFDFVDFDPAVGPSSATPGELDMTFDAIEVWNSTDDWEHLESLTLVDWYSFLNRGYRTVATGNSDTHELDQWAGQPRNLVPVEGALSEEVYYDSLLASRSQVTSAPFIEFLMNGQSLGSTVLPTTPTTPVTVQIRVSAPSWAPVALVQLVANGEVIKEWDVSAEAGLVRLETTLDVQPTVDTWYHVRAFDPAGDLSPVYPGRTSAAFTNPIWVDLDGDGFAPLFTEN